MTYLHDAHGPLVALGADQTTSMLARVPLGSRTVDGGVDEAFLQNLLFEHPEALPIRDIDPSYADAIPVCRELATPAGFVDALFVNALGNLTLVEFKLWRNPQARREVIGQILDYAKDLASWSYEDLQREVSRALQRKGNVLYEVVRERHGAVQEATFVDNVTRHLQRGQFLLLIVGDGIQEGVQNIVDYVQRYSGLHFNLALVEAALYRDGPDRLIVHPRVLARTEIVQRIVVSGRVVEQEELPAEDQGDVAISERQKVQGEESLRFWQAVLDGFAFSDVTQAVPEPKRHSSVSVMLGFNSDVWFMASLDRTSKGVSCYLSRSSSSSFGGRVFKEFEASLDELREEMGGDLATWTNSAGAARIGFQRRAEFLVGGNDRDEVVAWMRDRLDRLVSTLRPRIRRMLEERT